MGIRTPDTLRRSKKRTKTSRQPRPPSEGTFQGKCRLGHSTTGWEPAGGLPRKLLAQPEQARNVCREPLQLSCQMPGRGCQGLEQEHDAVPTVPPNCPGSSSRKADPAHKARRHRQSHRHRGPAVPKLSGRIRATGSPPGHPPAGEHPAGPAGNRTPATLYPPGPCLYKGTPGITCNLSGHSSSLA